MEEEREIGRECQKHHQKNRSWRDRETEIDRERERQTDTDRDTERQRDRESEWQCESLNERYRDRQMVRKQQ